MYILTTYIAKHIIKKKLKKNYFSGYFNLTLKMDFFLKKKKKNACSFECIYSRKHLFMTSYMFILFLFLRMLKLNFW